MIASSLSRSAAVLRRGVAVGRRGLSHMGVHKNKYFEVRFAARKIPAHKPCFSCLFCLCFAVFEAVQLNAFV